MFITEITTNINHLSSLSSKTQFKKIKILQKCINILFYRTLLKGGLINFMLTWPSSSYQKVFP